MSFATWKFDVQEAADPAKTFMVALDDVDGFMKTPQDVLNYDILAKPHGFVFGDFDYGTQAVESSFTRMLVDYRHKNQDKVKSVVNKGVAALSKPACEHTALFGSWSLVEPWNWPCLPSVKSTENARGYVKIMENGLLQ